MIRINSEILKYIKANFIEDGGFTSVHYKAHELIVKQDTYASHVYIVEKGIAKCYLNSEDGKEFIQEFFGVGQLFGEAEVFNDSLNVCSVRSISPLKAYKATNNYFKKVVTADRKFNEIVLRAISNKILYKAHRHSFSQYNSIASNLAFLKKTFPELHNAISKQDIANYLGITLRSLNRVLKSLNS